VRSQPAQAELTEYDQYMRIRRTVLAGFAAALLLPAGGMTACSAGSGSGSGPSADRSATSSGPPSSPSPAGRSTPAADPAGAPTGAGAADWPTYHRTNDRAGQVPAVATPTGFAPAWAARLDGPVYGQPLVVGSSVLAATENDTVYALDLGSGRTLWSRHVGSPVPRSELPCGNIDPLGITGTPAYDSRTRTLFAVAETTGARHDLVALDVATGAVRFRRNLDVTSRDPRAEQQRSALAVAGGRVYVPFGGLYGDCGNYVGYVAALATDGTGAVARYEVPTSREGGIWAPSGPAVAANGDVYVAVGNGAAFGGRYDGSDSVLRLSADLSRRISFFAPSTWGTENSADADLGSTGPLLLPGGLTLIAGKTGDVYLLDAADLGGIGGHLARIGGCAGYGGMAYADGSAYVPCQTGLMRVDVLGRTLRKGWQASRVTGSPVVGGNAVYALDPFGGVLYALAAGSGRTLARTQVGEASRFSSPVLAGGKVLVGTNAGVTAVTATR
jgi:outer membrane protein assembly factor BamB